LTQKRAGWLPGIEGLRAVAALSVLTAHVFILLSGTYSPPRPVAMSAALGLQGVTLFFCLSGFLLYAPFVRAALRGTRPSAQRFYRRRFFRIAPGYLVIFLFSALVIGTVITRAAAYGEHTTDHVGRMLDPGLLLSNLLLVQGYFPRGVLTGLTVSWSLVPEVVFYLLLPGLAWLGIRAVRRFDRVWWLLLPAGVLILVGLVCHHLALESVTGPGGEAGNYYRGSGATWSAVFWHSFLARCHLFGFGMVAAVLVVAVAREGASARSVRGVTRAAWAAVLVGVVLTGLLHDDRLIDPSMGMLFTGVIILVTSPGPGWPARLSVRFLESAPMVYVGRISYSVYLWHVPVIFFMGAHALRVVPSSAPGLAVNLLMVVAVTLGLSSITYYAVEAPAMRRGARNPVRREPVGAGPATSLVQPAGEAAAHPPR